MREDADAALFAIKCFAAAMLAYYIALQIGLTRPYWAVVTSYIVAQPLAGAVLSKAVYRLCGTVLGAMAAVILVPAFVNAPAVLLVALGLWLAVCLYISLLDRTPRSYIFLLAGYTASIIGFPSVDVPGTIFTTAILRVQEIGIGILCASFVHGVIFPRAVTTRLLARIDAILADAERWSIGSLAGEREAVLDRERRRLAVDLAELHQLSTHLPFDTARLAPRLRTVRALQDQLTTLLPLDATIEDRLAELKALGPLPKPLSGLLDRVRAWLGDAIAGPGGDETAQTLIEEAAALEPAPLALSWADMLRLNLLSRLADLIATHRNCRALREQMRSPGPRPISPQIAALLVRQGRVALHRDRGLAARTAFGAFATTLLCGAFWIATGWKDGAGAVLIAAIACALFGSLDEPARAIRTLFIGSGVGLALAIVYDFAILPRVTDFVMLAAVLAPALLAMAALMAKPRTAAFGMGIVIGFPQSVGLAATYQGDFGATINGALAQQLGIGFAVIAVGLFQTAGIEARIARLLRAGWRDVIRRAEGRARDTQLWASLMLDRVGLLVPRLAARADDPGAPLLDALIDMRIGIVAGDLDSLARSTPAAESAPLRETLSGIAGHYRALDAGAADGPGEALLADIDRSLATTMDDPEPARRRQALVLLTSLRRNLFPSAPPYAAPATAGMAA